jgi:anti-sigma B factor antagonist
VALSLDVRREGDVSVITCRGRIVDGDEATRLRQQIDDEQRLTRLIVLDLGGVDFLDSCGLGVLARALGRLRLDGGDLKLCAVPRHVEHVLEVTRLRALFDVHATAAEAIAASGTGPLPQSASDVATDILCVHPSRDVLTFVFALLEHAGFHIATASNVADASTLLRAAAPKLVIVAPALRAMARRGGAARFDQLLETLPVIEMPADFATRDAAVAGAALLADVRAILGVVG